MTARDTAYRDQFNAAMRETDDLFNRAVVAAATINGPLSYPLPVPDICPGLGDRHLQIVEAGEGQNCGHLVTGCPKPRVAVGWRPGWEVCFSCLQDGALNPPPGQGSVCDACGVDAGGKLAMGVLRRGDPQIERDLLVILIGLCPECAGEDKAPVPPAVYFTTRQDRPFPGANRAARRAARRKGGRR